MCGGICGYIQDSGPKFTNCINYGTVTATSGYAGGIIGYYGSFHSESPDGFILNCANNGVINSAKTPDSELLGQFYFEGGSTN